MKKTNLTIFLPDEAATLECGRMLSRVLEKQAVIFLKGELGAGKTTLTRGILQGLGHTGSVKSPSYAIVEPYELNKTHFYHFDFYRVRDPEELEFIGLRDYFLTPAICLIEWPELGGTFVPLPDLICHIQICPSGRNIEFAAHSDKGKRFLQTLSAGLKDVKGV